MSGHGMRSSPEWPPCPYECGASLSNKLQGRDTGNADRIRLELPAWLNMLLVCTWQSLTTACGMSGSTPSATESILSEDGLTLSKRGCLRAKYD